MYTLLFLGLAASLSAQAGPGRTPVRRPPPGGVDQGPDMARRRMAEQQIRQRLWQVTKRRLALSDEQMTKLEQISVRFDQRRRQLGQQERAQRQVLRAEILADSAANQGNIASALERLQQIQRQRVEMQIDEQKEFATFMTPLQRARFLGLQEEFRKRMQELLRARPEGVRPDDGGPPFQSP